MLRRILKSIKRRYQKRRSYINKKVAIANLSNARQILNTLNMPNWLTDGTLLGFYRENDFIRHDIDMDMGCFIKDYNDQLIDMFLKNNWTLEHLYGKQEIGYEIAFRKNGVRLDIFFFYEENDKYWHGAWLETEKGFNLIKYYYDKFDITDAQFKGHSFNVPKDTLKYIETKYGPDWRTPKKNWDWSFGPSNAVKTDYYLPITTPDKIMGNFQDKT